MAERYAAETEPQQPTTPAPTPAADYPAKRKKFLTSFAALDPEAHLDEAQLGDILGDEAKRDEFVQYVGQLNPKFKMSGQELADALGFKKKVGGAPGSALSGTGAEADIAFGEVAPETAQPYNPLAVPGLPADSTEQVIPATFVGPRPAGTYQKRDDAGTVAEGTEYVSPASQAGQLNPQAAPVDPNANDSPFTTLGKDLSNLPATLENAAGDVVDYVGDATQYLANNTLYDDYGNRLHEVNELGAPITDNKRTDQIGRDLRADALTRTTPVSERAKQSVLDDPTNGAAWAHLIGQGLNSVVAVGAASMAGGPGAGIAVGSGLGISATKDAARQAGISDEEAMLTATALAPIQGVLEEVGAGWITKNKAVTGLLTKTIVGRALAEGGGKLTQTGLAKAASAIMPELVKRGVKGGTAEAVTEFLQGEAEGIAKLAADKLRGNESAPAGKGRYGTTPFEALVKSPLEQAIGGFAAGAPVSAAFHGEHAPEAPPASAQVTQRRRAPEGTAPITADRPAARLLGKAVVVRDDAGLTQLGKIHNTVGTGEHRAIIVRDAAGKLSRHPQANVYTTSPPPTTPTPSPASAPRTDPGPTADPIPTTPRPQAADLSPVNSTDLKGASAGGNRAVVGPTLGELVPESATEAAPLALTMGGEPVQAFRNAEGDVELHHADGQISIFDKGEQFLYPAKDFLLAAPQAPQTGGVALRRENPANPNAVKPGDAVQVGGIELPIEDVLRNKAGEIEAVMVAGKNGSRIIEADTPDGKAALAELNAREAQATGRGKTASAQPAANEGQIKIEASKALPAYGTPSANREAGAFSLNGKTYTRQEPITRRAVQGNEATATFANDVQVPVRYALIEADELQPSHTGGSQNLNHFIPEAQPKNRSAAFDQASQQAIRSIADAPDVAQLGQAPTAYAGAPIVNGRGEVIQGNGRGEGIRQHYRSNGTSYRAGIVAEAQKVGIDPKQAAKMKRPVLVRIADVSDAKARELGNYTAADTESGGRRRLDVKQAANRLDADARADLGRLLAPSDDATLTQTIRDRQPEILAFLQRHKLANTTQLQTLFKPDGTLTPQGMEDVTALHRQLLFAEGEPNLPELFADLPAAAQNGLDRAVGALAGLDPAKSITPEIQNAIIGTREFLSREQNFELWLRSRNMFAPEGQQTPAERFSPLELALIKLLATEKRPTHIARIFTQYAVAANGLPPTLFDATPALSRADAIQKTFNVQDANPRNAAGAEGTPRPSTADGRPAPSPAPGMASPAENAQRASQPAPTANQPAGAQPAQQQLADGPAAKRQAALDNLKQRRAQQTPPSGVVQDYTQNYQLREGEPETSRESGHQALKAAQKARRAGGAKPIGLDAGPDSGGRGAVSPQTQNRGKVEVTQLGISPELRHKGVVSFVGRTIRTIGDIAEMAQILRDPRMETARYYFTATTPDGKETIVSERAISSRMPGATPTLPITHSDSWEQGASWVKEQMAAVGATRFYLLHNHPSGIVSPSQADLHVTLEIAKRVPGFGGHVIINHRRFTVLSVANGAVKQDIGRKLPSEGGGPGFATPGAYMMSGPTTDAMLRPSKPGALLGRAISGPDAIATLAKETESKEGFAVVIGRGASGRVTGAGTVSLATLADDSPAGRSRARAALRSFQRETGAVGVIVAGLPKPTSRTQTYGKGGPARAFLGQLIREGFLLDAVEKSGEALSDYFAPGRAHAPVQRVREDADDYGISEDDLADYRTVLTTYAEEGTTGRKALTARFREDVGSEGETGISDERLRQLIKETQQAAGVVPKAKPKKELKERRHAARYDEVTRRAFTEDERRYMPRKVVENQQDAAAYIQQVGLENAMAVALDKPEGISGAAHLEIQEAVAREYRRLSDAAQQAGDRAEAERLWGLSKQARAAKVSALTEHAQSLAQMQGFVADQPDAVLDAVVKTAEQQAKPKLAQAEKAGAKVAQVVTRVRRKAMDAALNSEAVQKAREAATANADASSVQADEPKGYGQSNKYFPKLTAAELKAKLRGMGFSTIVPPELVQFVGYHVEALARVGGKNSFAEVSKRVVRDLGARVKPLLPAAYEKARAQYLKRGGADAGFTEPADVAALVAPAAVKAGIRKLGTTLDRIAREHAEGINPTGKSLAERFAADAGLDPKTADAYAKAVEAEFSKQVLARKSTLANRILTFQTRVLLGKNAATAVDKLLSTLNLATDPNTAADLLKAQLKLPHITKAQADEFVKLAEAVRKAPAGFQRAARVQDLLAAMSKVENVDWRDAAQAMWFANTLSGPLTHVTNVVSNAHQAMAETLISVADTWANTGSLKAALGPLRGIARAQRAGWAEALRVLNTGYVGTSSEKFDVAGKNYLENKQFTGAAKPLNGLKYVQRALVAEDNVFASTLRGMRSWEVAIKDAYKEVKREASLSGEKLSRADLYERATATALGKLYGLPDLLAAANSQADAEQVAPADRKRRVAELVNQAVQERVKSWEQQAHAEGLTGLDKSMRVGELQQMAQPADLVADAEQFARENTFNDGLPGTFGAMAGIIARIGEIPVVGLKVGRIIAPFTRIAASVLDRHLDYTPWGFVRAAKGSHGPKEMNGGQHYRALTPEQRSKAATRAILGTVSALTLYGLAKAGEIAITGGYAGDKDKDEQEPEYSIKFKNGAFISYKGWPVELQLATLGNLLAYDRRLGKKGQTVSDGKRMAVALGLIAQYSASVGPTNGLDEFTAGILKMSRNPDQSLNYLARFATGTAKNMVPYAAADQQLLRGFNILRGEKVKENTADTMWEASYNSLVADVPHFRDSMEDAIGILGEPMRLSSTRLWGWLPQERTPEDQKALDWLAAHSLLPARKRVSDDDLAVFDAGVQKLRPMTDAEFKQFQIARGHAYRDLLRAAFRKPSEAPGLDPALKALLLAHPELNKSLPELDPKAAKKKAMAMQKQAVKAGKETVKNKL